MPPKKEIGFIKLQIPAGQANPAPPVGPALGQHGVNIMDFCKAYNAETQDKAGQIIPVEISVYADTSFTFIVKTPPASSLILKAAGLKKGSSAPGRDAPRMIQRSKLASVAEQKMPDLNAYDIEAAVKIIEGSARSMGFKVVD